MNLPKRVGICTRALLPALLPGWLFMASTASAQLVSSNFSLVPPLISESATPNVMLVMSNDHELYKKAYSDYSDLDGDGLIDSTYNDSFTYTGYFDSNFCYSYSTASGGVFEPAGDISASIATNGHRCNLSGISGNWSGNFLNWVTMTRMDIVRHVLFGGKRSTDSATSAANTPGTTVLERSFLPEDAHSYVKVFAGDTARYTPWSQSSISLCNVTLGSATGAPLFRVAYGSWPLWSSAERVQCYYRGEAPGDAGMNTQVQWPTATASARPEAYNYTARVKVCVPGKDSGNQRCKPYAHSSDGRITYKPIGLLQQHGDNATINFGLMTGSYSKNISGGVLRKNIMPLTGNTDTSLNEINLDNGVFLNQGALNHGIIKSISEFYLTSWNYASNVTNKIHGDCNTWGISKAEFMAGTDSGRRCSNWGNPLSEIYLEALRYFTGNNIPSGIAAPTAAFNTSDASHIASLPQLGWSDPLNPANACASCSIIVLSTGLNSFDKDELASVSDLWDVAGTSRMSLSKLNTLLDSLGTLEGITGGSYLIGDNGTVNDESCNAKTITHLSRARGICPEIASLEGGYDIAALAWHAYTKDLRSELEGLQTVSTYSVALAENLPKFELNVNGKTVAFVPTCQSHSDANRKLDQSGWTNCSFLDIKIEQQNANGGRIYVTWEDSLWGSDFDMDVVSRIEWCIGTNTTLCPGEAPNANYTGGTGQTNFTYNNDFKWKTTGLSADSVQMRASGVMTAGGYAIRLGYSISGVGDTGTVSRKTNTPSDAMNGGTKTINDGGTKYIARGNQGNGDQFFLLVQGNYSITRLISNSGNRMIYHEPLVYTANANSTVGKRLENPLYYAAKYGSFNDTDADLTPRFGNSLTDRREWDTRNVDGQDIPDGIPDNFFPISNPARLSSSLSQIFEIIAARISSGTAAAVVANSSTGLGSVYQAYYHPQYTDTSGNTAVWGGVLHSMFIDDSGRFREDNGTPGKLDDPNTDYVVHIEYDTFASPPRTRFQRYTQSGSGVGAILTPLGDKQDLEELNSIWNARDVLANISQSDLLIQRTTAGGVFNEDAAAKRYIFTYLDSISAGTQGIVDAGEVLPFTHENFDASNPLNGNNFRYLGMNNPAETAKLVKYIRGQDQSDWRSRLVDIPGDGTSAPKYWLLGDIVHSSPLVVNPPDQRYDINNGDLSYAEFKRQYQRRRQMIYAGGNDGMLHAFNGGIWDPLNRTFQTQGYNEASGLYNKGQSHTLGAEMWAYVPMNLLPHLQWLKERHYPHVYYVDAPPQSFDVNIFTPDARHPGGWGTILVVGMRLGGGEFPLDLDGDGSKETVMRSAYVILDVTDPEGPPQLIAEITAPDMGFTTSMPTLIKSRVPNAAGNYATPVDNQWLLVFGSGPDTLVAAVSNDQDAKLFAYDLVGRELINLHANAQTPASEPSGFFGDFAAADWNNDYVDDVVYAGTVEGSESAPSGRMKRIVLDNSVTHMGLSTGAARMSQVINVNSPLTAAPTVLRSIDKNEKWLLFGSGRLFTTLDNRSTTQQSYFGIKEADDYSTASLTVANLVDSTDIIVQSEGPIWDRTIGQQVTRKGEDLDSFNELYSFMDDQQGWVRHFAYDGGVNPSERVFNTALVLGSTLVFTSYLPSVDQCLVEGDGFLYALNYRTGTAETFGPFGQSADGVAFASVALGQGAPSAPTAIVRTGDDAGVDADNVGDISVITGSTTGVTQSTGFSSAPVVSGRLSWEELVVPF